MANVIFFSASFNIWRVISWSSVLVVGAITYQFVYNHYFHPLARYPGPFWAGITKVWYVRKVIHNEAHITQVKLHEKYGPVVRLQPNLLSFSSPDVIPQIYGYNEVSTKIDPAQGPKPSGNALPRSLFYLGVERPPGVPTVISSRPNDLHTRLRKRASAAYSQTRIVGMEEGIDRMVKLFVSKIRGFAALGSEKAGKPFDFAVWAQYFTFDTVLMLTHSKPHGFMEHGSDYMGYISNVLKGLTLFNYINHFPWLIYALRTKTLQKFAPKETDKEGLGHLMGIGRQTVRQRLSEINSGVQKKHDILQGLVDAKSDGPETSQASEDEILAETMIPFIAGSDSTATAIRAIVLELGLHPPVLSQLRQELHQAWKAGSLSEPVQLAEMNKLRYLDAVIRESIRTRPSTSVIFRREVPVNCEGLLIYNVGGLYNNPIELPPGTEVGMNPYVIAKSKDLYGDDARTFRPERWFPVSNETNEIERVKRMERLDFAWLWGPRTCLGKGIASIEIRKSIIELVRNFDFELLNPPDRPWDARALGGFFILRNMWVKVRERDRRQGDFL